MNDSVVKKITNSSKRKSLFHFTRVRNLPSIVHLDALYSCNKVDPTLSNERRIVSREIHFHGNVFIANAHLRIADQVMDAKTTHRQFHNYLDQHVFFWPTQRDCQKMLEIYSRREPDEAFAILQLDAHSLLCDFYDTVKLSKYDSGSSPRYPTRCSYKKSLQMFLPLDQFEIVRENDVPSKPSEIREVLVEEKVTNLSRYLQAVYCKNMEEIPERLRKYAQSFQDFKNRVIM
ncbi:hypothetical protein QFZ77_007112 [Paenibacillus sp. V4I3]|uniref:DUF7002 family protein n=1 Tax=Paenibacillus sp. V4I3 TaxID=3042305 RepID=UPI0027833C1A|nr:hypothetical protein [Paenibacillus sp. V4I3]MDQ0878453.1 hypothetical protein [Paenibacillus sp. V4I3]